MYSASGAQRDLVGCLEQIHAYCLEHKLGINLVSPHVAAPCHIEQPFRGAKALFDDVAGLATSS
jgi:hypothetical protein